MGRQNIFPLAVFGILLLTALAALLAINYVSGPLPRIAPKQVAGHAYTETNVPSTYAPPIDFGRQYLSVAATPGSGNVNLRVTVNRTLGVEKQYIYKIGKYSRNGQWQNFTFDTPTVGGSNWILNDASYAATITGLSGEEFVITYVCRKYTGDPAFYCGPSNGAETKKWTIQNYTAPTTTGVLSPNCTINGVNYTNGTQNAGNSCQYCNNITPSIWTNKSNGVACSEVANGICTNGVCAVPPAFTCEIATNQICGSGIGNATLNSTGTCQTGSCYKCNLNYKKQGSICVFDTASITCTNAGQICTAVQPANSVANSSAVCSPGEICYQCAAGFSMQGGQCVANTATNCTISGQTYASNAVNPSNSCQYCNLATPTQWTTKAAGTACTTSASAAGTCSSAGTCVATCTPQASLCSYSSTCATTGTDNCGNANAICNRQTNGNSCGTNQMCSNGACVTQQCSYKGTGDPATMLTCSTCSQKERTLLTINSLNRFSNEYYAMCCAAVGQCGDLEFSVFSSGKIPQCSPVGTTLTPGNGNTYTCMSGSNWQCSGTSCPCTSNTQCTGGTTCQNGFCAQSTTTATCSYVGTSSSAPLDCSTCSGKPYRVQTTIDAQPYSLTNSSGTYYYALCCAGSNQCADSTYCYNNGDRPSYANDAFICYNKDFKQCKAGVTATYTVGTTTYTCDTTQNKWVVQQACAAPKCVAGTACIDEGLVYSVSNQICINGVLKSCPQSGTVVQMSTGQKYTCLISSPTDTDWTKCGGIGQNACPGNLCDQGVSCGNICRSLTYACPTCGNHGELQCNPLLQPICSGTMVSCFTPTSGGNAYVCWNTCSSSSSCAADKKNYVMAGNGNWATVFAVSSSPTSVCCSMNQCVGTSQCYNEGQVVGGDLCAVSSQVNWASFNNRQTAAWYTCDSAHDGQRLTTVSGSNYCCSNGVFSVC